MREDPEQAHQEQAALVHSVPAAALCGWNREWRAGVLVLEELEHARARGAPILAEFLGGSFTCDAHHMTEPQPQGHGVRLCIQRCGQCQSSGHHPLL